MSLSLSLAPRPAETGLTGALTQEMVIAALDAEKRAQEERKGNKAAVQKLIDDMKQIIVSLSAENAKLMAALTVSQQQNKDTETVSQAKEKALQGRVEALEKELGDCKVAFQAAFQKETDKLRVLIINHQRLRRRCGVFEYLHTSSKAKGKLSSFNTDAVPFHNEYHESYVQQLIALYPGWESKNGT